MNIMEETNRYPASEKPGEAGIYKRFAKNPNTDVEVVHYCLFDDGWWYEGSVELTSALNEPLRRSHFQDDGFEWCGVMPGSYERPDVQAVKTENFVSGFFTQDNPQPDSIVTEAGQQQMLDLALEEPAAISEAQQFGADFFGEQP